MFDSGARRNVIARKLGVSGATVSRICHEAGRSFDRAQQLLELRAEKADLDEMRQRVSKKMLLVADDVLEELDAPYLVYNFGGKDNTYQEHLLDGPPLEARLDAMRAASLAVDKASRIVERMPDDSGQEAAFGVLDSLAAGFDAIAARIRERQAEEAAEGEAGDAEP